MLYSIDSCKYITKVPHSKEFNLWVSRLSTVEYDAIIDELNNRIDGNDVNTSSWIPGNDWTGTVYEPIYTKACNNNIDLSGQCFGLILFKVMIDRKDVWGFGRYKNNGMDIKGITYFKLNNIP
ncbi:hypothetical protein EHW71_02460 [Clostridium butyricum]|jgi:hypothetical protein|uniref:hypothetical protein n=1 Tax=Clostridium butyricum TaxID=1492 RepID=UPI000F54B0E9|nr:hypothetical protein [Clostridium butyricum]RQN12498.1 hypothetical protein EHW71_02460 [Clostridium butyricum]